MSVFNPNQFLDAEEQRALEQYQIENTAREEHNRLLELIERTNTLDVDEQRRIAQENLEKQRARREYSKQTEQSLYEESEKRIADIIKNNVYDPNEILRIVATDPVLSITHATDQERLSLVDRIQSEQRSSWDPVNAIAGKTIEDMSPLEELGNSTWSHMKHMAGSLWYKNKKTYNLERLNQLPTKELNHIQKKLNTVNDLQSKINALSDDLESYDPIRRANAVEQYTYYKNELNKLGLTPEEKITWDRYGDEFSRLNFDTHLADAELEDFADTNVISTAEADRLKQEYALKDTYKRLGETAGYTNPKFAWETIKNNFNLNHIANGLGVIASSALPMIIAPVAGTAMVATSELAEKFADNLQYFYDKHGELPTEKQFESAVRAAATTAFDLAGTKILVKGLGNNSFLRDRANQLKDAYISARALGTISPKSLAYAVVTRMRMQNMPASTAAVDKAMEKALAGVTEAAKGAPKTLGEKAISSTKSGIKAVNTSLAKVGSDFKSTAKAGASLAFENTGAILSDRAGKDNFDPNEVVDAAMSGLIGGSLFHFISSPVMAGVRIGKDKFDTYRQSNLTRIDTGKEWQKSLAVINDADNREYKSELIEAFSDRYSKLKEQVEKHEESALEAYINRFGEDAITQDKEGNYSFVLPKDTKMTDKEIASANKAIKQLNKVHNNIVSMNEVIDSRLKQLDELQENTITSEMEEYSKEGTTKERKNKIAENVYLRSKEEAKQIKMLMAENNITEEHAKNILKSQESGKKSVTDTDFINAVAKYDADDADYYADIAKDSAIKQALVDQDKEAFDKAIEANTELSKARKDYLKNSIFDRAAFNYAGNTENNISDEGFIQTKDDNKRAASYKDLNKTQQKTVLNNLKESYPGLKDESAPKWEDITASQEAWDNAKKDENKLKAAIANEYLSNESPDTVEARLKEDLGKKNITYNPKDITDISERVKNVFGDHIRFWNLVRGKEIFDSAEAAKEAEKEIKKENPNARIKTFTAAYGTINTSVLLSPVESLYFLDTLNGNKSLLNNPDATVDEVQEYAEKHKEFINTNFGNYKGKGLGEIIAAWTQDKNNLPKDPSNEKQVKEFRKKFVSLLANIDKALTPLSARKETIKAGKANKYTQAQQRKAAKREIEAAEKEAEIIQEIPNNIKKLTDEDITIDVKNALYSIRSAISIPIDPNNPLTQDSLDESIAVWAEQRANENLPITTKDVATLTEYKKKVQSSKSFKNKSAVMNYLNTLEYILRVADMYGHVVRADKRMSSLFGRLSRTGYRWESGEETNKKENELISFYNSIRDIIDEAYYISDTDVPLGNLNTGAKELIYNVNVRRKTNELQSFHSKIRGGRDSKRRQEVRKGIQNIFNTLKEYHEGEENGLSLIAKELESKLTKLEKDILSNPDNLSKYTSRPVGDLFEKMLDSKRFKAFFGLSLADQVVTDDEGKSLTNRKTLSDITSDGVYTSVDSAYSLVYSRASFNKDSIGKGSIKTVYQNVRDLDKYLNMEGSLFKTFWNKQGKSSVFEDIAREYDIDNVNTEQYSGLKKDDREAITKAIDDGTLTFSENIIEKMLKSNSLKEFEKVLDSLSDGEIKKTIKAAFTENGVLKQRAVAAMLQYYIANKLGFKGRKSKVLNKEGRLVFDTKYEKLLKQWELAEVLKYKHFVKYETHTPQDYQNVDRSQFSTLAEQISQALYEGKKTLKDLFDYAKNPELEAENALTEEETNIFHSLFEQNGIADIYAWDTWIEENPELANKLSRFFTQFINKNQIANVVATNAVLNGSKQEIAGTNKTQHIENDINASAYANDISVGHIEDVSPMATDNFITHAISSNTDYADVAKLETFLNEVRKIARYASNFSFTKGNLADEIFATLYEGVTVYNQEVVNTMAAVALNHLTRMAQGQNSDWIQKQVNTGVFTQKAGLAFSSKNFLSKNNLGEDLGSQILGALNIRATDKNSRAIAIPSLSAALAGRTLAMLQEAKLIKIRYFNKDTGAVSDEQQLTGNWMSVVELTQQGRIKSKQMIELNSPRATDKGNKHILNDLLGFNNKDLNFMSPEQYQENQTKLKNRFDKKHIRSITPSSIYKGKKYIVDFDEKNEIARIDLVEPSDNNHDLHHYVYLSRHQIVKKDKTLLSYSRLIENAFQNDTPYTVKTREVVEQLNFLDAIKDINDLNNSDKRDLYYEYLGLEKEDQDGFFNSIQKSKNSAILKSWLDMYKELKTIQEEAKSNSKWDGTTKLHFPVINTINNRVFFESLGINPREFKPTRIFFTPNARIYRVVENSKKPGKYTVETKTIENNKIPARTSDKDTMLLKSIICGGLGLDADKATIEDLAKAYDKIAEILNKLNKDNTLDPDDPPTTLSEYLDILQTINANLAKDEEAIYETVKGNEAIKVKLNAHAVDTLKELLNKTNDTFNYALIDNTSVEFDNLNVRVEVDGITNGTGIHFTTSGWIGNQDMYSYQLLAGVGIFPKPYDDEEGSFADQSITDFVHARLTGTMFDSYERLGAQARKETYNKIMDSLAKDIQANSNLAIIDLLGQIYDVKTKDIKTILDKAFGRNIMKYVLMPNSYGAGKDALVNFLSMEMSRALSKKVYALRKAGNIRAVYAIYDRLKALNGNSPLKLMDADGNIIEYTGKDFERDTIFSNYSVLIDLNTELANKFNELIFIPTAQSAAKLTNMAQKHVSALTTATETLANVYNSLLEHELITKYADQDLNNLTIKQVEDISSMIGTQLHIGNDESSLGLLKEIVNSSIGLLTMRTPSLMRKGKGVVITPKDILSRESITSALSPEHNHTIDSDIINRTQAEIREKLGAFLGVHDAMLATYAQLQGDENAGVEMNKQFFDTQIHNYRPIIEYIKIMQNSLNWVQLRRLNDRYGAYDTKLEADIMQSIKQLKGVLLSQVRGRNTFLDAIINTGVSASINQYAMDGIARYKVTSEIAKQIKKDIAADLSSINMVDFTTLPIEGLKEYINTYRGVTSFWDEIKGWLDAKDITNIQQLLDRLNNKSLGANPATVNELKKYIYAYLAHYRGEYDDSFYKSLIDATTDYFDINSSTHDVGNINSLYETLKTEKRKITNDGTMNYEQKDKARRDITRREILNQTISLAYTAVEQGFITNATDLTTFIEVNSYKLGQRLSTDYNAYSVINNLVALTSDINITDLDRLSEALVKAGIEDRETSEDKNKNNRLNLAKFNENANSIIIDVDDISVPDLLAHFNKLSAQEGNDVSSYVQGYITNYIEALEKQLRTTEATQIVFQMNKAIDKVLFSAINKKINTAVEGSLWRGKTIAILPAITNNADGAVDSNVYFKNAIVNKFSPENVNYFSIMANNNYKDVTGRNFLYGNKFTNDYIRGNYIARRTEEMPVKFNSLLDVEPEMQEVLNLDTTEGSYIGISNALGYLDSTQFSSAVDTTPSYAHISKGDYSDTMYNADRIIKEYSQAYQEGTEALENYIDDQSTVPYISDVTDDEAHILQANTDSWEEYIKPDGRLSFGITSSGMVNSSNAYHILKNKPELWAVYNEAKAELARRERYFENGTYKFRDAIYIPIEKEIFIDGTKMNVQFLIVRDDKISVAEAKENLVNTAIGDYRGRLFLNWKDGTPAYLKNKFAFNQEELQNMSFANGEISKFLNRIYSSNVVSPERTYIKIPDSIANKHDNVMNYKDSYLARMNQIAMTKDNKATVYMGLDANRSNIYNNDESVTVSFEETPSTKDNNTALSNKFNNFLSHTLLRRRKEAIAKHHYTYDTPNKSDEEMTEAEYAMYRDINCNDIDSISENLNNEDLKYGIDNNHLMPILSQVKHANMLIRYRLNEQVGRNGEATLARVNGVKVGYVMHGLSKNGEGSNLELFTHELVHIPLDFLNMDSSALNTATQLYNFVAKNITIDDFNTGDREDKRIYNYLFNNTSADNVVEFLDYALTNARFKEALNNLMARNKVKQEFDSKLESCINRFFDTLGRKVGDTTSINIDKIVDTIFNRSIDLAKHYYKKYRSVPTEAYEKQSTMLQKANTRLFEGIKKLFSKPKTEVGKAVNAAVTYASLQNQMFNPNTIQDERTREGAYKAHVPEIMPRLTEYLRNQELVKGDLANSLAQSLQGVSANNWSYVKMRLAAKEIVDKAREKGASAVNSVVREITQKLSTKTTNNLPEYLIHADMQCLLNGRNADEVINLMADKEARYNEIKKIEATLLKAEKGNYFINSAKGLANKLLYGINTSGIGYNNAYEIANMSGTSYETKNAPLTSQIDQLVTLYTMHELNKQNPSVYKELSKNAEAVKELLNMHSNMISIERNKVYGDTVQKYHIPKGELHGAKSNNRYEVIPESQLKAYQWVGYKKVKNAKLDSFYSKILPENYVIVEAKFMPDVPYVDGVTVLTDIFKGRNKNGTYIGGKQIESTEIDFNSTVYPSAQSYLNNQINQLNSPSFTQLDYNKLDGVFTPSFGLVTGLKGVDFSLNEKEVNTKLGKQFKITSVLGDHYGSIIERTRAPEWNQKVAEMLDNIYNERKSKQEFTWLTAEETDKDRKELYDLLPYEIKKYFNDKYGDKGIPIENQFITGILGYRQASAAKVDTEYYNKLRYTTTEYIDHLLHSKPVAYGESLARWLAQVGKENIVIKGIVVSVNNIISNCVTLGIQGLKPKEVFDYQSEALTNLKNYNILREQYEILKYKQDMGMNTVQDNMQIKALKESMHKNPISYLAEHGAIPQIAEDLTEIDRPVKDIVDRYIPKEFQTIAHNVLGDQKSAMYQKLSQLATFGDVTAKYALFKHLTEDVGINKDEALRQSIQAFIDYSNVLPKPIQYLDSIGMLPFTKFLLGNQTNVMNTLVKNPTGATSWIMANSWMNTSDIYGSVLGLDSFTNRLHMPGFGLWYQSLASLPIVRATKFGMDIL